MTCQYFFIISYAHSRCFVLRTSNLLALCEYEDADSVSTASSAGDRASPQTMKPTRKTPLSSPSSRSSQKHGTTPTSPPFTWAREFECEYFKGKSTDPGFFPPTALESAAYLVAALHGKSDMVLNSGSYKRDAKTPAVETLLRTSEEMLMDTQPDAYVHPINAEILLDMQNKISQNKRAARNAMKKKFLHASSKGNYLFGQMRVCLCFKSVCIHTYVFTYMRAVVR